MLSDSFKRLFPQEILDTIFPGQISDQFFEALFGDAEEGAYDIRLTYGGYRSGELTFQLELHQRPGKCLACNLTYGLPTVFSRHPIIDMKSVVNRIETRLNGQGRCLNWELGPTREVNRKLHIVPLKITLQPNAEE
jgi:hypothetical protein